MLNPHSQRAALKNLAASIVAFLIPGVTACENMLEVRIPGQVAGSTLQNPAMAPTLVNSAIADFECAFVNYVGATGLLTDELIISTEFIAPSLWDQRRIAADNGNLTGSCTLFGFGVFRPLHTARYMAEFAIEAVTGFPDNAVPNKNLLLATANAYAGYAYALLGEAFCSVTIARGPALEPAAVLAIAEERFTRAIALAEQASNADILNMARVGRARVRLNLKRKAEAAADARLVPTNYVRNATYSAAAARRNNLIHVYNQRNLQVSVDPRYRGLQVDGVPDVRVPVQNANRNGQDGFTPLWLQLKYTGDASSIVLASWKEAQLIIAEAEGGTSAVQAINALRAHHSLPSYGGGSAAEILAQVIEERRRELFLEGHRLNDMLRHDLSFDSGLNHKGVPFGDTTCLPLPDLELANS